MVSQLRKGRLWLFVSFCPTALLFLFSTAAPEALTNLLGNPSFEEAAAAQPLVWQIDSRSQHKGSVSIRQDRSHAGDNGLELTPNNENTGATDLLGVGQAIAATPYRGKSLKISGWMAAEGDAKANIAIYVMTEKIEAIAHLLLQQPDSSSEYRFHEDYITVPETDSRWIVINCFVEGKSGKANFDDLFLGVAEQADVPTEKDTQPLRANITIDANKSIRSIPSTLFGTNAEWKWDGNGIWDRERKALQEEIVELTRAMRLSLIRYPAGTMSDYYHWKESIGPIDARPFRSPVPGESESQLLFGTDEALEFAKRTNTHLLVTVNMVTGDAKEAADWVEYINKEQAEHDERKYVTYWQLGNENYIQWIPGVPEFFRKSALSAKAYVERVKSYSEAMRAVDPSIKLIGILDSDPENPWNHEVLAGIADKVDYVAIHNGYAPGFVLDRGAQIRKLYQALLAKPLEIRQNLRAFSEILESLGPGPGEDLKLAVTEWGPIFSVDIQSPYFNHTQTLGSALYAASTLMALIDSPRTEMANFFHLVGQLHMGWLGMREGHYIMKPTALALQLFTGHFGDILVESHTESPTYDSRVRFERIPPIHDVPYLEALASVDEEQAKLFVMVVNKHFDVFIDTEIVVEGFEPIDNASVWTLTGTGLDSNLGAELFQAPGIQWPKQMEDPLNPRYAKGGPGEVEVKSSQLEQIGAHFRYSFPPQSVTAIELRRAP